MDKNKANLLTQDTPETSSDEDIEVAYDPDPRNQRNQGILSAVKKLNSLHPQAQESIQQLISKPIKYYQPRH